MFLVEDGFFYCDLLLLLSLTLSYTVGTEPIPTGEVALPARSSLHQRLASHMHSITLKHTLCSFIMSNVRNDHFGVDNLP